MKKLYLLRHAQASHPRGVGDKERPLNERGRQECKAMNAYLKNSQIIPDIVICSDALRTIETAREVFLGSAVKIAYSPKLYLATAGEIIKEISKISDTENSIMIISHNPGIQQFANVLSQDGEKAHFSGSKEYPTCGLTEFLVDIENWHDVEPGIGVLGIKSH